MKKTTLLSFLLILFFSIGMIAHAQAPSPTPAATPQYDFLAPLSDGTTAKQPTDLPGYLLAMYRIFISLSGVLAVVAIVYGGVVYMSTDAITGKKEGKEIIKRSVLGLVIVIAAALILTTINPEILNFSALGLNFK